MIELEGTRNERAIVMIACYIIGFVSAYIWFGLTATFMPTHTPLADRGGEPEAFTFPKASKTVNYSSVTYEEGMLQLQTPEGTELLSMASHRVPKENRDFLEQNGGQGVHEDIISFMLSPDAKYVFFCENHGDEGCSGFIFDTANDLIRPIRTADGRIELTNREALLANFSANGLEIGEYRSVSPAEPWLLTQ